MQKVKNLWKLLSLGVVGATFGLMMASCVETGDEEQTQTPTTPDSYKVSVGTWDLDTRDTLVGVVGIRGSGSYKKR